MREHRLVLCREELELFRRELRFDGGGFRRGHVGIVRRVRGGGGRRDLSGWGRSEMGGYGGGDGLWERGGVDPVGFVEDGFRSFDFADKSSFHHRSLDRPAGGELAAEVPEHGLAVHFKARLLDIFDFFGGCACGTESVITACCPSAENSTETVLGTSALSEGGFGFLAEGFRVRETTDGSVQFAQELLRFGVDLIALRVGEVCL